MVNKIKPGTNETLDSIKNVKIIQAKRGYRFSVDAILLENFISASRLTKGVELGTGSGIISILLAKRIKDIKKITAVEIQKSMAARAERNVILNGLDGRIDVLSKDLKMLKRSLPPNKHDFVFSNPPFRKPRTGRLSVSGERAIARHEIEMTLQELTVIASYLLKHNGKFFIIYHPFRLAELISQLRNARLEPKRMRFVHSRPGEEAKMVLVEAVKGSGVWLKVEPPIYIYEKGNKYSAQLNEILDR